MVQGEEITPDNDRLVPVLVPTLDEMTIANDFGLHPETGEQYEQNNNRVSSNPSAIIFSSVVTCFIFKGNAEADI